MASLTDYSENKLIDFLLRAQSFTPPATQYVALYKASAGISPRSTAVTSGQTTVPATSNGRMYRCSTAGTTGSGEPTWPTTSGGTVTDGTAVWTEMSTDFEANNSFVTGVEIATGSYARVSVTAALTAWAGTQSAGSTAVSSGTSGTTSNNNVLTFPAPTANWGVVAAVTVNDASTVGNSLMFGVLTTPKTVNNADPAPSFSAAALSYQIDN